jgi:hypothetical protein
MNPTVVWVLWFLLSHAAVAAWGYHFGRQHTMDLMEARQMRLYRERHHA